MPTNIPIKNFKNEHTIENFHIKEDKFTSGNVQQI